MTILLPKSSRCPFCDYEMDAATHPDDDESARPKPGDLLMCISCTSFLKLDADLRLVILPDAEFRKLPADLKVEMHQMQRAGRSVDRTTLGKK